MQCPHLDSAPAIDGDLTDWDDVAPLPPLQELDGEGAFAEVFVAWNADGLYIAERCHKRGGAVAVNRRRPHAGDGLELWIDTRATQTAHRATRFCHRFILLPRSGGGSRSEPMAWQGNIRRAREQSPLCDPSQINIASAIGDDWYIMEAHLPTPILAGLDPTPGARIGFNYHVHDLSQGRQFWSAPRGFPMATDPSLWGLLELAS